MNVQSKAPFEFRDQADCSPSSVRTSCSSESSCLLTDVSEWPALSVLLSCLSEYLGVWGHSYFLKTWDVTLESSLALFVFFTLFTQGHLYDMESGQPRMDGWMEKPPNVEMTTK